MQHEVEMWNALSKGFEDSKSLHRLKRRLKKYLKEEGLLNIQKLNLPRETPKMLMAVECQHYICH